MSEKQKYIASLDIGTTKIVSTLAHIGQDNQIEVVGLSKRLSKGVKRGIIFNMEETIRAIKSSIDDILIQTGIKMNLVNVNIGGQHIEMQTKRGYIHLNSDDFKIHPKDVSGLTNSIYKIPLENDKQILDVIPVEYFIDSKPGVVNPTGMIARKLEAEFLVLVGQLAAVENVKRCVDLAGLETNKIVANPMASSLAVLSDKEKEDGVVLVDTGGETTDITIYHQNAIRHIAVIPFAGNYITGKLKKLLDISAPQAEALKLKFASALSENNPEETLTTHHGIPSDESEEISFKDLDQIFQAILQELVEAISYEIKRSGFSDKLRAGIVITGGSSGLINMHQLLINKTGLNVRSGLPKKPKKNEHLFEFADPGYSTSVGLLMSHLSSI